MIWIKTQFDIIVKIIRTNYDNELRNIKVDVYFFVENIQFKSISTNAQNVNDVTKTHQKTFTIMIKIVLLTSNIFDFLWLDIIIIMTYIKNCRFAFYLIEKSFYETLRKQFFKLLNMHSLRFTIYVMINKKNKNHLKLNVVKEIFIDYDDDNFYKVYLFVTQKIERVKSFDFYDHILKSKQIIEFEKLNESLTNVIDNEKKEVKFHDVAQIAQDTIVLDFSITNFESKSQICVSNSTRKQKRSQKISSRFRKRETFHSNSTQKQKKSQSIFLKYTIMHLNKKTTRVNFFMNSKIYTFISFVKSIMFHLTIRELLSNWDVKFDELIIMFNDMINASTHNFVDDDNSINSIILLINYIEVINVSNFEKFIAMLNVNQKKLNTYVEIMRNLFVSQWIKIMREELEYLLKNNI